MALRDNTPALFEAMDAMARGVLDRSPMDTLASAATLALALRCNALASSNTSGDSSELPAVSEVDSVATGKMAINGGTTTSKASDSPLEPATAGTTQNGSAVDASPPLENGASSNGVIVDASWRRGSNGVLAEGVSGSGRRKVSFLYRTSSSWPGYLSSVMLT